MLSTRMRNAVAITVTTVWAANFAAGLLPIDYQPDQAINGIFMAIVGALFTLGRKPDGNDTKGDGDPT